MGSGIAHVCALAGIPVVLNDIASQRMKDALATINGNMARQVSKKRITEEQKAAALKLISTAETYDGLNDCDLVIEAAVENEQIKRKIFQQLCPVLKPEALLATNTSSISITRLAASTDDLVPVKLRRGGRTLGGSLSWDQPQALTAFSKESPFGTMAVPNDVTVTRQVLAEPEAGLVDRTWATLADGTPLVTAVKRGKGMIVLFHVTADTRWSDLPLSGSFVEMLRRIVSLAGSTTTNEAGDNKTASPFLARACA